jgi:ParB family chromosome partitioning protein
VSDNLERISLDRLQPNQRNPRKRLRHVDELAESMRVYGLMQPIVVRPKRDGTFEVVAGHRRLAAAHALGWQDIPAFVRTASEDQAYLLTLVENLQRDDLSAHEEARALEVLVRERGWTATQVAESIHRSIAYVSRRLRVFEDAVLAPLVLQNLLTIAVAEELLPLAGARKRALAQQAIDSGWDRQQTRTQINKSLRRAKSGRTSVQRMASDLRGALQGVWPSSLSEGERRELRLLFDDLAVLGKGPSSTPQVASATASAKSARRRVRQA